MKRRTQAWIIFLIAIWFYPAYVLVLATRRFVRGSLDSIEKRLGEMDKEGKKDERLQKIGDKYGVNVEGKW